MNIPGLGIDPQDYGIVRALQQDQTSNIESFLGAFPEEVDGIAAVGMKLPNFRFNCRHKLCCSSSA